MGRSELTIAKQTKWQTSKHHQQWSYYQDLGRGSNNYRVTRQNWKSNHSPNLIKMIPFRVGRSGFLCVYSCAHEITVLHDLLSLSQSIGHLSCFSTSQKCQSPQNNQAESSLGIRELVRNILHFGKYHFHKKILGGVSGGGILYWQLQLSVLFIHP